MHKISSWSNIKYVKDQLKLSMVKCKQSGQISPRRFLERQISEWYNDCQRSSPTGRKSIRRTCALRKIHSGDNRQYSRQKIPNTCRHRPKG